jgi:hypothetical protein
VGTHSLLEEPGKLRHLSHAVPVAHRIHQRPTQPHLQRLPRHCVPSRERKGGKATSGSILKSRPLVPYTTTGIPEFPVLPSSPKQYVPPNARNTNPEQPFPKRPLVGPNGARRSDEATKRRSEDKHKHKQTFYPAPMYCVTGVTGNRGGAMTSP